MNNKKPNYLNNIVINISDIPNLQDEIQNIDYIVVSDPQNNETLIFNSISQKIENKTMPHSDLSSAGVISHSDLDNLYNSISISNATSNESLLYNASINKFENKSISHNNILNIGNNSNSDIDSFISSKGKSNGLATLNSSGQLNESEIPSIAISDVFVKDTLAERNALTNIQTGDVCIVVNDGTNNGSYIYRYRMENYICIY